MIPLELFDHVLDGADCPTINSVARTCSQLAQMVRGRTAELAARHATSAGGIMRMPNGMLHGKSTGHYLGQCAFAEFKFGVPTYWNIGFACGRHGFQYAVCIRPTVPKHFVRLYYQSFNLVAYDDGSLWTITRGDMPDKVPTRGALVVNGRIDTDAVGEWVARVHAVSMTSAALLDPPPYIITDEAELGKLFRMFDSLDVVSQHHGAMRL